MPRHTKPLPHSRNDLVREAKLSKNATITLVRDVDPNTVYLVTDDGLNWIVKISTSAEALRAATTSAGLARAQGVSVPAEAAFIERAYFLVPGSNDKYFRRALIKEEIAPGVDLKTVLEMGLPMEQVRRVLSAVGNALQKIRSHKSNFFTLVDERGRTVVNSATFPEHLGNVLQYWHEHPRRPILGMLPGVSKAEEVLFVAANDGNTSEYFSMTPTLTHGYLRGRDIFVSDIHGDPKITVIDWDRSHFSSPLIDTASIMKSVKIKPGTPLGDAFIRATGLHDLVPVESPAELQHVLKVCRALSLVNKVMAHSVEKLRESAKESLHYGSTG